MYYKIILILKYKFKVLKITRNINQFLKISTNSFVV